jgi:MoxR-like ATPase
MATYGDVGNLATRPPAAWSCSISRAERDDIERAARQTLRVIETEERIFEKAVLRDQDEALALAQIHAAAGEMVAAEATAAVRADPALNHVPGGAADTEDGALQQRIRSLFRTLSHGLIEREPEVRLMVLAALCREHLLLLGPPGTAKSALSRRLSTAMDARYFERQLTRFTVPEELFGPLSLTALQQDRYERRTVGYLPEASIAFIDEIFKANSAILNSLLTIINERQFDNGSVRENVPLICLVGASNEPPEDDELEALFDRFLFRRFVEPVSVEGRPQLLQLDMAAAEAPPPPDAGVRLTREDIEQVGRDAEAVTIPADVQQLILDLLAFMDELGLYVSDRRLVKSAQMLRVAALTSGRTTVSKYDCLILMHVLWKHPSDHQRIQEWFVDALREPGSDVDQVFFLLQGLATRVWRAAAEECTGESDALVTGETARGVLQTSAAELAPLKQVLMSKLHGWEDEVAADEVVLSQHLWHSAEDMNRLQQRLRPNLERRQKEVSAVLLEIATLDVILSDVASHVDRAVASPMLRPHVVAAALPRHGRRIACELLKADANTSDKRLGLQLVKAVGLGYLLPTMLQQA